MHPDLLTNVHALKGVGEKRANLLQKLGIETLFDLVTYYPRAYEDRTTVKPIAETQDGELVCIEGTVASPVSARHIRKGLDLAKVRVVDDSGAVNLTFFNQNFVKDQLEVGETYCFYGKMDVKGRIREMNTPVFEPIDVSPLKTRRLIPVYSLTAGMPAHQLSAYIRAALARCANELTDPIPDEIRMREELAFSRFSYENIHYPTDETALEIARKRLIFEELFLLSLGLLRFKSRRRDLIGAAMGTVDVSRFEATLPYTLTGAQKRAIADAVGDMQKNIPMNRLVQGDVGSGKTVVAAACAYFARENGYQTALMAPTEILAEQHLETLTAMMEPLGIRVALLTGSMTAATKRKVKSALAEGEIDVLVGTHAILTEDVAFSNLGLVITDEQHRFGVRQRAALTAKGKNPHLLVMSATPIPRTLALILYGDLEVSVIDELPPGRKPIGTYAVDDTKRDRAYGFVRSHLDAGRQAYIVCPLVEENDTAELKSVEEFAKQLESRHLAGYRVEMLHGRMKGKEKERIMREFAAGEIHVLVSTTVIEVGVNVPNATVMVIENAERFGLSQLHQLRGRVGRGAEQSHCILFSEHKGGVTRDRLRVMCKTNDGFEISEADLKLRGPGDLFGTRQHGFPDLKIADLARDLEVLRTAQAYAKELLRKDPELRDPSHAETRARMLMLFDSREYGDTFN